jgi:hypothetical protein
MERRLLVREASVVTDDDDDDDGDDNARKIKRVKAILIYVKSDSDKLKNQADINNMNLLSIPHYLPSIGNSVHGYNAPRKTKICVPILVVRW